MQRTPRRRYTDDFKAQAVALAESVGPAQAARQLDMSVKTIANWLTAHRSGKPLSSSERTPVSELRILPAQAVELRALVGTEHATDLCASFGFSLVDPPTHGGLGQAKLAHYLTKTLVTAADEFDNLSLVLGAE